MTRSSDAAPLGGLEVAAYRVPTGGVPGSPDATAPESDGTLVWDATGLVTVHVEAGGSRGFGYGYVHHAGAVLIRETLGPALEGRDAMDIPGAWEAMRHRARNIGVPGLVMSAIGVVDVALWDLKAKLLDISAAALLGARRDSIPVYGSGGFTSYSVDQLREQLGGWATDGLAMVKMKVGRHPSADVARVRAAGEAVGPDVELFTDANGAFDAAGAIAMAHRFAEHDVAWFEEPTSSDDRAGLRRVRDHAPPGMRVAAGEYASTAFEFRQLCQAEAADVLMPDVIRCGGFTGFLRCAEVCDAFSVPVSAHTAPQLSAHVCLAAPGCLHAEYFHDHARIAHMLLDGALYPDRGTLRPDRGRPGLGLTLKTADAERFRVA